MLAEQTCYRCDRTLPLESFNRMSKKKSGHRGECRECQRIDRLRYMAEVDPTEHAERRRASKYRQRFRKSLAEVEAIFAEADYSCEACGTHRDDTHNGTLVLDHNHACCSGEYTCGKCIRGVLCTKCNLGLGALEDSIEKLRRLLTYMEVRNG